MIEKVNEFKMTIRQHLESMDAFPSASLDWLSSLSRQAEEVHRNRAALRLSFSAFAAHLALTLEKASPYVAPDKWMEQVHLDDLYLAFACLQGAEQAIAEVMAGAEEVVGPVVQRFAQAPLTSDELRQELQIVLFVSTGTRTAKLASYGGQGPLNAWLRVVATRACIDYIRVHRHLQHEKVFEREYLFELPEDTMDTELTFLKNEYRAQFREAFAVALSTLSSHERLLLRYHVVDRLSIDRIGALFQKHRSTAARQLQQARLHLLEATKDELAERLQVAPSEIQSIIRLIQSNWDISVQRMLVENASTSGQER